MSTIATLVVKFAADLSDYSRGVSEAESQAEGFSGTVGKIAQTAAGFGVAQVAIQGIGKVFDMAKSSVFGMNSSLETSTLQFETMMGSSDEAKAHVQDLFKFAGATPFETGPIIQASRTMETFGGSALDTMDNLTLFGDASAATSNDIGELSFWMSRAYAGLQSGKPIGEATMRLQEMGVIGPQVVQTMDAMAKSGASGSEQWDTLTGSLHRFDGAMVKQAGTWQGLTSTFSDSISLMTAAAFQPFFAMAEGGLGRLNTFLAGPTMTGAVASFSSGMTSAFGAVGDGIGALVGLVSGPLSTVWTRASNAVQTFVGAISGDWVNASGISGVDKIVGNIGLAFHAVIGPAQTVIGYIEDMGKVLLYLAGLHGPEGIAEAFNSLPYPLKIILDLLQPIIQHFGDLMTIFGGPLAAALHGAISGFGDDGLAGILPGAISGIMNYVGAWGGVLDMFGQIGTVLIDVAKQIDWGQLLGDAASIATGLYNKLVEAVGQIDWSGIFSGGTDVAGSILGAITGGLGGVDYSAIASAIGTGIGTAWGALTDAATWLFTWITTGIASVPWVDLATSIGSGIGTAWGALTDAAVWVYTWITTGLASIPWADMASAISTGVGTAWGALSDAAVYVYTWITTGLAGVDWNGLASQITGPLGAAMSAAQGAAGGSEGGGFLSSLIGDMSGIIDQIQPFVDFMQNNLLATFGNVKTAWTEFSDALTGGTDWSAVTQALSTLGTVLGGVVLIALSAITLALKLASDAAVAFAPIIGSVLAGSFTSLAGIINTVAAVIAGFIKIVVDLIHGDWSAAWADAQALASGAVEGIKQIFSGLPAVIGGYIAALVGDVLGKFQGLSNDALGAIQGLSDGAIGSISGMVGSIQGFIGDMVGTVEGLISGMVGSVQGFISDMVATAESSVSGMAGSIQGFISDMVSTVTGLAQDFYDAVTTAVRNTATDAGAAAGTILSTIRDALADLYTVGYDAIMGLKNGFEAAFQVVFDIVGGWIDKIGGALSKLHVPGFSPLDEAGFEMGMMFGGGIAKGLENALPLVEGGVQTLGQAIAAQVADSMTAVVVPKATMSGSDIVNALVSGLIAGRNVWQDTMDLLHGDALTSIAQMQADLQGKLKLAEIAGDDTADLKQKLSAVTQIITMWANNTGEDLNGAITSMLSSQAGQQAMIDQWNATLNNIGDIISGKARADLVGKIEVLNQQIALATAAGAPQAVIDGFNATLATTQDQLAVVGAAYATAMQQGMVDAVTPEYLQGVMDKTSSILDGTLIPQLQGKLDQLNSVIAFGTAAGWSSEVLDAYKSQQQQLSVDLEDVMSQAGIAAANGLLDPKALAAYNKAAGKVVAFTADQFNALIPKMSDFGMSLVGDLAAGFTAGSVSLDDALGSMNAMVSASLKDLDKSNDLTTQDMIDKLQGLESEYATNLAKAMLDGTDPTEIEQNMAAIEKLLEALSAQAKMTADDIRSIADAALAANNAANGIGQAPSGNISQGLSGTIDSQKWGGAPTKAYTVLPGGSPYVAPGGTANTVTNLATGGSANTATPHGVLGNLTVNVNMDGSTIARVVDAQYQADAVMHVGLTGPNL